MADARLIEQIRMCARQLSPAADEVAKMLQKCADEIEAPTTREEALKRFDEFAWHYKGLRDLIIPGVSEVDWNKQVKNLSRDARAAIKVRKPPAWWQRLFQ